MPPDIYKYEEFEETKSEIRLLKVISRNNAGVINLQLSHVEVSDHTPRYNAISYTWGNREADKVVFVNSKQFHVRENAYHFLRNHCTNNTNQDLFWMDTICINQDDLEEKSWQVAMMGRIFAGAEKVLIWLGRQSESDVCINPFSHYHRAYYGIHGTRNLYYIYSMIKTSLISSASKEKEFESACLAMKPTFEDLISADYWERLWIVQEVALARSCCIVAATGLVPFSDIVKALCERNFSSLHQSPKFQLITSLYGNQFNKEGNRGIVALLKDFKLQQCYDLRDRIYGLLSLSQDLVGLSVSYQDSPEVLFAKSVRKIVDNEPDSTDISRRGTQPLMEALGITSQSISQSLRSNAQAQEILTRRTISTEAACTYVLETSNCLCIPGSSCRNDLSRLLDPGDQHVTLPAWSNDQPQCFVKKAPYAVLTNEPLNKSTADRVLLCGISGIQSHLILSECKPQGICIQQCFSRDWEPSPLLHQYLAQFEVHNQTVCTFFIKTSPADLVLLHECFEPAQSSSASSSGLLDFLLETE